MVPDKIYVREYPDRINQFWDRKKRDDVVATIYHEYICKDTLLKCVKDLKAQIGIEVGGCSNMLAAGEWLAYDKLIEKIESM